MAMAPKPGMPAPRKRPEMSIMPIKGTKPGKPRDGVFTKPGVPSKGPAYGPRPSQGRPGSLTQYKSPKGR